MLLLIRVVTFKVRAVMFNIANLAPGLAPTNLESKREALSWWGRVGALHKETPAEWRMLRDLLVRDKEGRVTAENQEWKGQVVSEA